MDLSRCEKCGEDDRGLVHPVEDSRGVQNFCGCCGHSWWVWLKHLPVIRDVSGSVYPIED